MSLKFWLGGAKSDKSRRLINYILDEADKHPDRQYLFVAPEQFGLAMQRELVLNSKNHGILNIDVLSFTRLAHRITDEVGSAGDVTMLDEMGKSLIIGMLANSMKDSLTVFGRDIDKLGYVDRIKSVISEFMQYGVSCDKAFEMSRRAKESGRGQLSAKLNDIAVIYKAFREYIKDRYTTVEEMLDTVCRLIPQSGTVANSVIVFDGFTGFTPVQNKLIGVLMEHAISVHVALFYEDCIQEKAGSRQIQEHELFYLSKHTMHQLGKMADERCIETEDPYKAENTEIDNICNIISNIAYTNTGKEQKLNNVSAHVFKGRNPDEETGMVITRIFDLIRNEGYRYRDIAILAGDIESYRSPIERQFSDHGIPFFIDRTDPVLLNPFIEYIRAFIDILSDNYSQAAVFRYLKSGLTGFDEDRVYLLENYCLAANIKGYSKWHARFDMQTGTAGAEELLLLNGIRERFVAGIGIFTESLSPGKTINAGSKFTVRQFATALYRVIEADGIEDKLRTAAKRFEEAGDRKLSAQYDRIYVKIMDILDELCLLIPDEMTDIRGFGNLLDAGFDAIRTGALPAGMDYVQVGDLTRSRLNDIKALFIVGANDGLIPKTASSSGLINENEREWLLGTDEGLTLAPTAREDVFTQQLYIYMATSRPEEHLFVSFSGVNAQGKSMQPSFIVKKLLSLDPAVRIETKPEMPQYYTDEKEAFDGLCDMIYPFITGKLSHDMSERAKGLLEYFLGSSSYREHLISIIKSDILCAGRDPDESIGSALAHILYGKNISSNITKLESYAKCAYRYFLQYGLKLKEREVFSFEAKDIGNIFHDSMKEYSYLMEKGGHNWSNIDAEEQSLLMDAAVSTVIERYRQQKLSSSARYAHMEARIRSIMKTSADIVSSQIRKGKFVPKYFEVDFDRMDASKALSVTLRDDEVMRLRGRIDRVDTCETEDGIYVKIIDYKSSKHEMDLAAVYEGRQLQLLVYLGVAMEMEKKGSKEVRPAGVLYYRIDDPVVPAKSELSGEDIHRLIMKELSLKGLVNSDPAVVRLMDEDIGSDPTVLSLSMNKNGEVKSSKQAVSGNDLIIMCDYVTKCIRQMGIDITDGNIAIPQPDNKTRFTGPDCAFCPYTSICNKNGFTRSTEEDEDSEPSLKLSGMKNEDWIRLMKNKGDTQ